MQSSTRNIKGDDTGKRFGAAFYIAVGYGLVSLVWILASDLTVASLVSDHEVLHTIQAFKGSFFVAVTTMLLYLLLTRLFGRLEKALGRARETEAHLTLAVDAASIILWEWIIPSDRLTINQPGSGFVGYAPDSFPATRQELFERIHPGDIASIQQAMQDHLEGRRATYESSYRIRSADDEWRWVMVRGKVVEKALDGSPLRAAGTMLDITETKRMETDLAAERGRFLALFEHSKDAIILMEDGRFLDCNPRAEDIYGYSRKELKGISPVDLSPSLQPDGEPSAEKAPRFIQAALQGKPQTFEWLHLRPDGSTFLAEISLHRVGRDEDSTLFAIGRNITQRRENEDRLRKAKRAAEAADTAKSEFLAIMSHELRTPLNGAMGMLHLLQKSEINETQQHFVKTALAACRSLTRLLGDILDLSKIESGDITLTEQPLNPREIMENIRHSFAERAEEKSLDFSLEVDEDVPSDLVGDPLRVSQVLFNLVGNAVKFTEEGRVTVRASVLPSCTRNRCGLLFHISDTGPGIEDSRIDTMFEAFTQGDSSFSREYEGAGLGLRLVKRLIQLMDANLSLDSEPGKGTDAYFGVYLKPASDITPAQPDTSEELPCEIPDKGKGARILLAEDDAVNRLSLETFLEQSGFAVDGAVDGREALELFGSKEYDLVLMDVRMPRVDGIKATSMIRDKNRFGEKSRVPIIAITAHAMKGDRETFLDFGMDGYLAKPVDFDELLEMIRCHLKK